MRFKTKLDVGLDILKANIFRMRSPISAYLSVTDRCPYRCKYCNVPNRNKREMNLRQISNLINDFYRANVLRLQLVGGEPMMRDDIAYIIDYAKSKRMFISLSSTGYSISKRIKELKNVDILFLSFDGESDIHDYHKGRGSYQELMEAIEGLTENNKKFLTVTVLTGRNKNSIDFILDKARKKGFFTVFQPLLSSGCIAPEHLAPSSQPAELLMLHEEYKKVLNKLIWEKKQGAPIASSQNYLEHLLNWEDFSRAYSNNNYGRRFQCWAGSLYCYIDTDGLIYPCDNMVGLGKGLNCLDEGFDNSFRRLSKNGCRSCIVACEVEKNLMFSLNFNTMLNWSKVIG